MIRSDVVVLDRRIRPGALVRLVGGQTGVLLAAGDFYGDGDYTVFPVLVPGLSSMPSSRVTPRVYPVMGMEPPGADEGMRVRMPYACVSGPEETLHNWSIGGVFSTETSSWERVYVVHRSDLDQDGRLRGVGEHKELLERIAERLGLSFGTVPTAEREAQVGAVVRTDGERVADRDSVAGFVAQMARASRGGPAQWARLGDLPHGRAVPPPDVVTDEPVPGGTDGYAGADEGDDGEDEA